MLPLFCVPTMCLSAPRMDSVDTRCICWYNYYSLELLPPTPCPQPEVCRKRIAHPVSAGFWKQEPMSPVHVINLVGAFGSFLLLGLLSEGPVCLRVGSDDG